MARKPKIDKTTATQDGQSAIVEDDTLRIIDGPLASGYNPHRKRALSAIKWIVVHYTGCNGDAHTLARSFSRPDRDASTHYFVDETEARAVLPWRRIAWHIGNGKPHVGYIGARNFDGYWHARRSKCSELGCTNNTSVSVDICAKNVGGEWVLRGVDNAAKLVKMLMDQLDIDADHVVTHRDCTGKPCPRPWAVDPSQWDAFKNKLK